MDQSNHPPINNGVAFWEVMAQCRAALEVMESQNIGELRSQKLLDKKIDLGEKALSQNSYLLDQYLDQMGGDRISEIGPNAIGIGPIKWI